VAATIILYATPFFMLLIIIELMVDVYRKTGYFRINDSITSLALGIISRTHRFIVFGFAVGVYAWVAKTFAITQLPADSWPVWILSFVLYDFCYYWFHRFSHSVNFLWAGHVVHHQSEEYNLTTALRQTSTTIFAWVFYIPSFLIGIPAEVFFVSGALNLLYQFWVHTRHIGRLGWYEKIFVTPSNHRVHHGQNEIYIDKNHGGVFILWDRMFGTFQDELDSEPVIYGVRRPLNSFNPIWANFHTWQSLIADAIHTKSLKDKFRIWFMPTGWRPADVEISHPNTKIKPEERIKYDPQQKRLVKYYGLLQYMAAVVIGVSFILSANDLSYQWKVIYWLLITAPLITTGMIYDNRRFARILEGLRLLLSIIVLSTNFPYLVGWVPNALMGYLGISTIWLIALSRSSQQKIINVTK